VQLAAQGPWKHARVASPFFDGMVAMHWLLHVTSLHAATQSICLPHASSATHAAHTAGQLVSTHR
jgi:hypothetical protein